MTIDHNLEDLHRLRQLMIEQSRDGIVVINQSGKVTESNPKFAAMLGYSIQEVEQLFVWDWDAQFEQEQIQQMLADVDIRGDHFITRHRRKDGSTIDVEISSNGTMYKGRKQVFCICRDITERKQMEAEKELLIEELRTALAEIKTLRSILPICSYCKKIRDDKGYWERVEVYIKRHLQTDFSHGICPKCARKHFPEDYEEIELRGEGED